MRLFVLLIGGMAAGALACGGGGEATVESNGLKLTAGRAGGDDRCWEVPFTVRNSSGDKVGVSQTFTLLYLWHSETKQEDAITPSLECGKVTFSGVDASQIDEKFGSVLVEDGQTVNGRARYRRVGGAEPRRLQVMATSQGRGGRVTLKVDLPR